MFVVVVFAVVTLVARIVRFGCSLLRKMVWAKDFQWPFLMVTAAITNSNKSFGLLVVDLFSATALLLLLLLLLKLLQLR